MQAVDYSAQLHGHVCESLDVALNQDLPVRIPLSYLDLLQGHDANFVLGRSEVDIFIQAWLAHEFVGSGEIAVAIVDGNWLGIIQYLCCASVDYDAQGSSVARTLPIATVCVNGADILKHVAKGRRADLHNAIVEIKDQMFDDALRKFPRGSTSIIGVVSCDEAVKLHRIDYDGNNFHNNRFKSYAVNGITGRIAFLVDIVKLCRWFIGIDGPNENFCLIPNLRI